MIWDIISLTFKKLIAKIIMILGTNMARAVKGPYIYYVTLIT